jgi:hypothetical protein
MAADDGNAEEEFAPPQGNPDEELAPLHAAAVEDLVGLLDVQHGEAASAEADAEAGATLDVMHDDAYASTDAELGDDDGGGDDAEWAATAPLLDNENDPERESDESGEVAADMAADLAETAPVGGLVPHHARQAKPARRSSVAYSLQHLLEPVAPGRPSIPGCAYALGAFKLSKRCTNAALNDMIAHQKYVLVSPGAVNEYPSSVYKLRRILGCRGAVQYKFHWCPGYKCGHRYPEVDGELNPEETCPRCGEKRCKVWIALRVLGSESA